MWQTCARNKTEKALRAFIKRIAKVDHPRFLRVELARKVILALEVMMKKAGFDPKSERKIG
jgi:predicted Ser/Thr protein kinase